MPGAREMAPWVKSLPEMAGVRSPGPTEKDVVPTSLYRTWEAEEEESPRNSQVHRHKNKRDLPQKILRRQV